jgi:TadE-like protein
VVGTASSVARCPAGARGRPADRGTATAEVAVLLPALVLLTALCVSAVGAVSLHVRCLDAARSAAREIARGEPAEVAVVAARDRVPGEAEVQVRDRGGGLVAVVVTARAGLAGWSGVGVQVGGEAVAAAEDVP